MNKMKKLRPPRILLSCLGFLILIPGLVSATTRYISPSGNDTNNGTSEATPYKSFSKAFTTMTAGDELVLLDGTYSNSAGTGYLNWDDGSCAKCGQPPSGSSASMTVVRAKNPGSVKVDGGSREGLFMGRSTRKDSFIKIQGITFEGGGILYNTASNIIKDCGFHKTAQDGGDVFGIGTNDGNWGNTKNLIEDCWIWGKNRIIASNYRAHQSVWRRVVIRGDGCGTSACTGSGNPNVGITVYNSGNVSMQNIISVDRILGGGEHYADFASAQHNAGGVDTGSAEYLGPNEWLGTIALNSPDEGYYFEGDDVNNNTAKLENVVAWKTLNGGIDIGSRFNNTNLQNVTVGYATNASAGGVRLSPDVTGGGTVRNIIVTHVGGWGINSAVQPSYSNVSNTGDSAYNQTTCAVGCRITDPQNDGTPPSLKYIARVESGSVLDGTGANGADYGANVVKRYGTDGARQGEANYNTLSDTNLWPWPNEARIKADLCANETRGFCSKPSLTDYIWTFLGNPNPYGSGSGDTTSPTVSISSPTTGATVSGSFSITANASDNVGVTKVEFYVNGTLQGSDTSSPYAATWNTTAVANGSYALTAKAFDAAGNVGNSSTVNVTVSNPDSTPPTVSISSPTNNATVSGAFSITASASDNVGVTKVEFYVNGTLLGTDTAVPYTQSWNTLLVTNGSYALTAKAYDAAGNIGTSSTVNVTVSNAETTPPTVSITSPVDGANISGTISIAATASDNVGVTKVEFYVNGALQGTDTSSPYTQNWNTSVVADGSYVLTAKAYDAAGNVGMATAINVTVFNADVTPPTVSISSPASGATISGTVFISGSALDNVGVTKVEFYVNGTLLGTDTTAPYARSWNTTTGANGSYDLLAKAYDLAGNIGTSATVTVTVANPDLIAPTVSISSPTNGATVSGAFAINATASDNIGVTSVEFYVDGVLQGADGSAPYSYTWDSTFVSNGSHALSAKAHDAAGNIGTSSTINITVDNTSSTPDTTAPTVSITAPIDGASVLGTVTIAANASDNVAVTKVEFYVNGSLIGTDTTAPYTRAWNTTFLANGPYTLTAKAYDGAGNIGTSSTINVTVANADTIAPSVSISAPANGASVSGIISIAANASDNVGVTKLEFYVNGALLGTDTSVPYTQSWNTTAVSNGSYALTTKAYDAAGNIGTSATVTVTVANADTVPPTVAVTAPANGATVTGNVSITASASDNIGVTKVEFYVNGALLGTDSNAPYSQNWNAGSFAEGTYQLTAKAYDAAGNVATSAINNVVVDNPDSTPPTVSISSPTAGSSVSGTITISANASDNVSVSKVDFYRNGTLLGTDTSAPYTQTWNTASVSNGSYTLTARATDSSGNVATSASVSVTVANADVGVPTTFITSPTNGSTVKGTFSIQARASDNIGVTKVEFYVSGTLLGADFSGPYSRVWDTTSVSNGAYALTTKAYDAAGNVRTSAAVNVTVNNPDIVPPTVTITSPGVGATVAGPAEVSIVASDNFGVSKVELYLDNVLQATLTSSPYSYNWDTTPVVNGAHALMAKAYDAAGNQTSSVAIAVTVSNAVAPVTKPEGAPQNVCRPLEHQPCVIEVPEGTSQVRIFNRVGALVDTLSTSSRSVEWAADGVSAGQYISVAGNQKKSLVVIK